MAVYYNEFDKNKAAWLRELIKAGAVADGEVDERSIADVRPDELRGFTQWHMFAGIGVWSYALRLAGWPDAREVFTFSCPCQPFSSAGKKAGFADRRHLWPECFRIVSERRPVVCFGEQVESPDGLAWLDLVSADLESLAYTVGATGLCSAGLGAPHARNRLFFVAHSGAERIRAGGPGGAGEASRGMPEANEQRERLWSDSGQRGATGLMGDATIQPQRTYDRESGPGDGPPQSSGGSGLSGPVGNSHIAGLQTRHNQPIGIKERSECTKEPGTPVLVDYSAETRLAGIGIGEKDRALEDGRRGIQEPAGRGTPGPVNGYWGDARWIWCRDDKWRPAQPAPFGLAHESAADLGLVCHGDSEIAFPLIGKTPHRIRRLRGYGDAIVAEVAAEFIRTCLDVMEESRA